MDTHDLSEVDFWDPLRGMDDLPDTMLLMATVRDTASSLDADEIMRRVVAAASALLHADTPLIIVPDEGTPAFLQVVAGPGRRPRLYWQHIQIGAESVAGRATRAERVVCCANLLASTWDDRTLAAHTDATAGMAAPIHMGDQIGVLLVLHHGSARIFSPHDIAIAEALAAQAAAALSNARLYAEALRRADRLAAVSGLGQALSSAPDVASIGRTVYSYLARVVPASVYVLAVVDQALRHLTAPLCIAHGREQPLRTAVIAPHDQVWLIHGPPLVLNPQQRAESTTLLADSDADHLGTVALLPLRVADRVVGQITLGCEQSGAFDHEALLVLHTMADQAAVALERLHLLEGERERVRQLEELDRMKDDFLSTVSHEVRNPLATLLGSTELLQRQWASLSEARRLRSVERIERSAKRIDTLFRDLLVLARIEAGVLPFVITRLNPAALAQDTVDGLNGTFPDQPVHITITTDAWVAGDGDRLHQIMANLLSNAAKYSPEGTAIDLAIAVLPALPLSDAPHADSYVVITVSDRGPGIPAAQRHLLFTRFGRLPGSVARRGHQGTGLGLFISHQIAQGMGGALWYQERAGGGSAFSVALPATPPPSAPS